MKEWINLASAAIIVFLLTPLSVTLYSAGSNSRCDQDCLYLLTILDLVLENLINHDYRGLELINYIKSACVEPSLRELHSSVYSTLYKYYELISNYFVVEHYEIPVSAIAEMHKGLQRVSEYASRLQQCSHDKEASKAVRVRIELKVKDLIEGLIRISSTPQLGINATIHPRKSVYEPGEEITLFLNQTELSREAPVPVLLLFPAMHSITINYEVVTGETGTIIKLRLPGAHEVESLKPVHAPGQEVFNFLLVLRTDENYQAIHTIRVRYYYPQIQISVPSTITRGTVLRIYIATENHYSSYVFLNDQPIFNHELNLEPGTSVVEVQTNSEPAKIGLNKIKFCINSTYKTLSRCFEYPFYIEPKYPDIEVYAPSTVITWSSSFNIVFQNKEDSELVLKITSPYEQITVKLVNSTYIGLRTGVLPIQMLTITASVHDPHGNHDDLSLEFSILVVNLPLLYVYSTIIVIAPALLSKYEKVFATVLIGRLKKNAPRPITLGLQVNLLKPYTRLSSRVLQVYYKALKKLGFTLPAPTETLREHYASSIHHSRIADTIKSLVWKLLVITEKDLYSNKKPNIEEALKAYEEVLDASAE